MGGAYFELPAFSFNVLFDWLSTVYICHISDHWFVVLLVLVSPTHLLPAFK